MQIKYHCTCGKLHTVTVMVSCGAPGDAEQLATEVLMDDEGYALDAAELANSAAESASAKGSQAKSRLNGTPAWFVPAMPDTAPPPSDRVLPFEKPVAHPKKTKSFDDDAERVPLKYWITLTVLALVATLYWGLQMLGTPTPPSLARRALTAAKMEDRVNAVVEMSALPRHQSLPELQRLLTESKDPDVRVAVITALTSVHRDRGSIPQLIAELDHPASKVRVAAFRGLEVLFGGSASFEGLELRGDDTPETIEQIKRVAQQRFEETKGSQAVYPPPD